MKKLIALMLCGILAVAGLGGCGTTKEESTVSNVTAGEVFDAINAAFAEKYADMDVEGAIPNMPMNIDDTTLQEKFGIDPEITEDYKGQIAGMMTNCDMLLVVKAKDGKLEDVVKGLEKGKEAQQAAFESYGVMGNLERLDASKIVTNGNYAALLMVGIMDTEAETVDFTEDVKLAEDTFKNTING